MHRSNVAAAVVLATGVLVAPVAPEAGGTPVAGSPVRVEAATLHIQSETKTVPVSCSGRRSVFAAGARIIGGDGGVVLTAMVPDPTLTFVTAEATARTGHAGAWTLVVYAVCAYSVRAPGLVTQSAMSSTVTATCLGPNRLTGTGFQLHGSVDNHHITEVAIGPELRTVRVQAGGADTEVGVTAYAICKYPTQPQGPPGEVATDTSTVDASWPKSLTVGDPTMDTTVYGVGATVTGPDDAFLTALIPNLTLNLAVAEADRAGGSGAQFAVLDGEEGSVTVYGLLIGTFH